MKFNLATVLIMLGLTRIFHSHSMAKVKENPALQGGTGYRPVGQVLAATITGGENERKDQGGEYITAAQIIPVRSAWVPTQIYGLGESDINLAEWEDAGPAGWTMYTPDAGVLFSNEMGITYNSSGVGEYPATTLVFEATNHHLVDFYGKTGEVAYVDEDGNFVTIGKPVQKDNLDRLVGQAVARQRWVPATDSKGDCFDRYPADIYGTWVQDADVPGYFETENAGPSGWIRSRECDAASVKGHGLVSNQPTPTKRGLLDVLLSGLCALVLINFSIWLAYRPKAIKEDPVQSVPTVAEAKAGEPIGGKPRFK